MNDNDYRVNLYDDNRRLWGCFYPKTGTLVKQSRHVKVEIDLSPYLHVDKKIDTRQKDNSVR